MDFLSPLSKCVIKNLKNFQNAVKLSEKRLKHVSGGDHNLMRLIYGS